MTKDLSMEQEQWAGRVVSLCGDVLRLDGLLTARLPAGIEDTVELARVGTRLIDGLEQLSRPGRIEIVTEIAYLRSVTAERTIGELVKISAPDVAAAFQRFSNHDEYRTLAETWTSVFRESVAGELSALSGKVAQLYAGNYPPSDMTPQMECSLYAIATVVSVGLGWGPSALAFGIGFFTRGCVGLLRPDP